MNVFDGWRKHTKETELEVKKIYPYDPEFTTSD